MTHRAMLVLAACDGFGGPWHLTRMTMVAESLGRIMTEIEVAQRFDDLVAAGCIRSAGPLVYAISERGQAALQRWGDRE